MSDLFYKIATLLSFLLIGTGSLLEAYKNNQEITSGLVQIALLILALISICIMIIIITYIYKQKKDDIIFKFNKEKKILNIANNSRYAICIPDVFLLPNEDFKKQNFVQSLSATRQGKKSIINAIIPSNTKDIMDFNVKSFDNKSLIIVYHIILPLSNDYCKGIEKIKIIKI